MIKKIITAALSGLIVFTALSIVSLSAEKEQEGYPYDDDINYAYLVEAEKSFSSRNDESLTDAYYRYRIRVRERNSINILSYDRLEILFKDLPTYLEPLGIYKVDKINMPARYISTTEEPDKPLLRNRDSEIRHHHSVDFTLTSAKSSWDDFVKSTQTKTSADTTFDIDISQSSAGGYKALILTKKSKINNKETETELSLDTQKVVYVYLDDVKMPGGIILAQITADAYSNGTYDNSFKASYVKKFVDISNAAFEKYSKEFKDEVRKYYNEEISNMDKAINNILSIKPKITKTIDMQVPYKGSSNKAGEQKANDDASNVAAKDITINTDAKKTAGETGFSVATAVVLGVAAAAAGLAGAGAAGAAGAAGSGTAAGSSGDEASRDEEAASYQMVIGKDFGDALKFGEKQRVWARMVELKNGAPVDRPDLTAGISIFSSEVLVGAASLRGVNMEAEVQIQENVPPEGVISFLYSGAHGSFQNNVRFRLLGKAEIKLASDKVNILSTDDKPFELIYELKNFTEEEPPLEITASSGFVALDMGKNDKQQTVILINPGSDADPWDRKSFINVCRCEMTAMDGKLPVKAVFDVSVCFEGIGTAYENLAADELEKDALIQCFTEAEKEKRTEKALWVPMTVMKWNEKNRMLEPDPAKADNLTWAYAVHPDFEFKTPESKSLAERVVAKAKLKAERQPAPATLQIDTTKKPSAYRVMAEADPDEGAALFDLRMTVVCEEDATLAPLELTARIQPNPDFKGMVRWFLEYPLGSAAADFITLGDVSIYHAALDFIESRVFPMSGVPWSSNLLWNRSSDSHYEHGRWDIMRESYIAIEDAHFPKGIDANEFKKVQTLVHELAHVIEDQHGSYKVNATSETHAYYLEHLSDVARALTDLESGGSTLQTDILNAINGAYWFNVDTDIIGDISNIGPWFGGKFTVSIHELFDKYAYHADTLGGKMSEMRRHEVEQQFRHWYFPGNLSESAVQTGSTASATGRFTETDGLLKGAKWTFVWNQGVLKSINLAHDDYLITVEDYHWTGGNELKLSLKISIADKNLPSYDYDLLSVTLDGGTFNTAARSFPSVRSFSVTWKSLNDSQHSLIYKKTGFSEMTSWTERKK